MKGQDDNTEVHIRIERGHLKAVKKDGVWNSGMAFSMCDTVGQLKGNSKIGMGGLICCSLER